MHACCQIGLQWLAPVLPVSFEAIATLPQAPWVLANSTAAEVINMSAASGLHMRSKLTN